MSSFDELSRRVEITSKARYHSSSRLHNQHLFSQWTLTLLVVGQIVIALVPALGLKQNFSEGYLTFGSIFFAVLVLAYSLLLGMGNYSARAVKLHECGMELGRLARDLHPHTLPSSTGTPALYEQYAKHYYDILAKYENHSIADYLRAHYEYYSAKSPSIPVGVNRLTKYLSFFRWWWNLQISWLKAKAWLWVAYSHYWVTAALIWGWIFYMVS